MRVMIVIPIILCLTALASSQSVPPNRTAMVSTRPPKQYTIEQFLDTAAIQSWRASFSSDESRILFSSNKTGIWNAYTISVGGGQWTPVTSSNTDGTYAVSFFPHDDRILISRGRGGNEANHLYVLAPGGTEQDLTPGDRVRALFSGWTRKGDAFYVMTNERDSRLLDIYRYDATTYARTLFFENKDGYLPGSVSDDSSWISLWKRSTTNDSDIYLWNAISKETRHISKHSGVADYEIAGFDRESKYLYFVTDADREFRSLNRYSLLDGKAELVETAEWDITSATFSPGGKYRASIVNADGRPILSVVDARTRALVALPAVPSARVDAVRFSRSETKLALSVTGDRSPNSLYVLDLRTKKLTKLIDSLNPQIDAADLVDARVVRFKARDGLQIPNVLWKPHQASASSKAPAVVWVHGGPGDQTSPAYDAFIQYLANHGYVVLGINNRGSSGYGKAFLAADDRKHGREPLWDCVDAKKYLQTLDYVDPERIGIMGGSYGGYMVLAALAFQPDEFSVGVDFFGVTNWLRTLENAQAGFTLVPVEAQYAEIGDPAKDRRMLEDISPLFHAQQIGRPLLVLQGANDPRVLKVESDEIVAAVKKNGIPVEYIVFNDEGHGFTKKANQIAAYTAVLRFLDQHLKRGR